MEYSVYDLIKILLRKWYVIAIIVVLVGGISVVSSQKSYQKALEDYEIYTTQTAPVTVETGTLVAVYQYRYELTDVTKYVNQAEMKNAFLRKYVESVQADDYIMTSKPSAYDEAERAFANVAADFTKLLTDTLVMQKTQAAVDVQGFAEPTMLDADAKASAEKTALIVENHFAAEQLDASTLRVTLSGLEKDVADTVLKAYLQSLAEVGKSTYFMKITNVETAYDFILQPVQFTDIALLSQTVMQKPEQAPMFIKTVGTASAFAFILACFGMLLATFVKDTRSKKEIPAKNE